MFVRPASHPTGSAAPAASRRFRGSGRHPLWKRPEQVSVIVLPLVVDGAWEQRRLATLSGALYTIRRALQRGVRGRLRAYWASPRRIQQDAAGWRKELGLTREALERLAYRHLERSRWLLHHVSKALAMHLADEVWTAVERHLFGDSEGHRAGVPHVGGYWDFSHIPCRARSHTVDRKWETFRLHGTLNGHLAAHRHPELPADLTTAAEVAASVETERLERGTSVLAQPWHLRAPGRPASWWEHSGPLAVVFNGGPACSAGELVLPVRLPQGAGRWPFLAHFLGQPERWHRVDVVRRRDASAPGGWAYEAHLTILGAGYSSPATRERRAAAVARERVGGVDGNVSNLAVVSFPRSLTPEDGEVASTRVTLSEAEKARLAEKRRKDRRRQRALDRSRRATNARQYQRSPRQRKHHQRRQARGLEERQVVVPRGARVADARGKPKQPYREDALSLGYRRRRAEHAEAAAGLQEARDQRARQVAADIVALHGNRLTIEKGSIGPWFRRWGRALVAFTPGRLIAALARECAAGGGALLRVGTQGTALSQHCLCGNRVAKDLGQRVHACPACGLTGDRDLVSAALAVFAHLEDPGDPNSARVDYDQSTRVLGAFNQRLEAAVAESTLTGPLTSMAARRRPPQARRGRAAARRNAGPCVVPTPDGSTVSPPGSHGRNPGFHNGQNLWKSA